MSTVFGKRLAMARAKKNLTQRELGELVGITWSQVSRYEAGKSKPRLAALLNLAKALNVEVDYLAGDSEDEDGREITLMLTAEETKRLEEFAESEGLSFNDAVQKAIGEGLKMKLNQRPDMLAQLEAEMPGAYEKLLKLLAKES
ncbi:helix-turn-helix transcriptional regulator [Pseudomonas sp. LJDD11]|uniref:helix-turn-helix domain-containing protein n=1 Tax=Pseudomonas sp. LJDD11 TaxID=2931984 RepID=UPI00211CBB37|nr:helix-turn-helix transcriptional regulator [Pseudomonas sp. LJDD11]MCQ9426686.1 helix-turn-helix transcriptional regulator [Pseudomonas sp. LJDD11]